MGSPLVCAKECLRNDKKKKTPQQNTYPCITHIVKYPLPPTNDYKSYSICTSLVATNGVPLTGEGGLIRDEAIIHISRNMAAKNGNPQRHVTAGLTEVYRWGHTWDPLPEWWRGV